MRSVIRRSTSLVSWKRLMPTTCTHPMRLHFTTKRSLSDFTHTDSPPWELPWRGEEQSQRCRGGRRRRPQESIGNRWAGLLCTLNLHGIPSLTSRPFFLFQNSIPERAADCRTCINGISRLGPEELKPADSRGLDKKVNDKVYQASIKTWECTF